jgi:hypothetical protein
VLLRPVVEGVSQSSIGIGVTWPSNVIGNTANLSGTTNLVLSGAGCNNSNNVRP